MIRFNEEYEVYEVVCEECFEVVEAFESEADAEDYEENWFYLIDLGHDEKQVASCCEDEFVYCDGCGHYHYSCDVNMYRVGYDWYCEESAVEEGYYMYCESCGDLTDTDDLLYHERSDAYYCEYCYPSDDSIINDWHYHKDEELQFNKTDADSEDALFFGLELEIDGRNISWSDNIESAEHIRENYFNEDEMYFEEDGSLWNGFELITQPMTYNFIQEKEDDFENMCNYLVRNNYTGEDNSTAGLHIHVSRENISDKAVDNLVYFLENNLEDILILSRRGQKFSRFASSFCFDDIDNYRRHKDAEGDLDFDRVMNCYHRNEGNRYKILNTNNYSTIEFRLFKSTLESEKLLATIDFVNTLVLMAQGGSLRSWHTVEDIIIYSDSKRLYDMYMEAHDKYFEGNEAY